MSSPYSEDAEKLVGKAVRDLPQYVADYRRHLRNFTFRPEPMSGGTAADQHLAETGHEWAKGCCVDPLNKCRGCHKLLPREAMIAHELYCSRACREAVTKAA